MIESNTFKIFLLYPVEIILGITFITAHAYSRFNIPPSNRSSTTAARYHAAAISYLVVTLILYLAFLVTPDWMAIIIPQAPEILPDAVKKLSVPLLAALFLTVLLPKLPLLAQLDDWLRSRFYYMAAIPYEARRLSAELRKTTFEVPDDLYPRITAEFSETGVNPTHVPPGRLAEAVSLWTKIVVLMERLDSWEQEHKFIGFLNTFSTDVDHIKAHYKRLSNQSKSGFILMHDLNNDADEVALNKASCEYGEMFVNQLNDLFKELCDFVSRAVLKCVMTHGSRIQLLKSLGFKIELTKQCLTLNQLISLSIIIFSSFVLVFVLSREGLDLERKLLMGGMITAIYCIAVMCAVFLKERWPMFAQRDTHGFRPTAFYATASTIAAILSMSFYALVTMLVSHNPMSVWFDITHKYPWMLLTFTTTFMTAFQLDNPSSPRLRWREGLVQAVVTSAMAYVVHAWLTAKGVSAPALVPLMLRSAFIGFMIGFLVPTWYRDAPRTSQIGMDATDPSLD
jgi:hypothetical protein